MLSSLSHVALLVPSVGKSASYLKALGIECEPPEVFHAEGTKEIYVGSYKEQSGLLLLVESISEGPYQRAMDKRGPSLHHIAVDAVNTNKLVTTAQSYGWKLHQISQRTMKDSNTAWLYFEGIPTLIEINQRALSEKPQKVSKLELSVCKDHIPLFEALGLGSVIIDSSEGLHVTVDGSRLSFPQIAGLK